MWFVMVAIVDLHVHCRQGVGNDGKDSIARPPEAEFESVRDQIEFAYRGGVKKLHIAHVSTPEALDCILKARRSYGFNDFHSMDVTCDVTPHHLFANTAMMRGGSWSMSREDDLLWKVNPPIRSFERQCALLGMLPSLGYAGCWIATDHANHLLSEKLNEPHCSGMPGITNWPRVVGRLEEEGLSDEAIVALTSGNALRAYGLDESVVGDLNHRGGPEFDGYDYGCGDFI